MVIVNGFNWLFLSSVIRLSPEWDWHISAGSTNPQLYCGLSCGPFAVNNQLFSPKPDSLYELGIRLIPMEGGVNEVWLYVVDWETKILYPIFKMSDLGYVANSIGGILEGFTKDESLLENIGGSIALFIVIFATYILLYISPGNPVQLYIDSLLARGYSKEYALMKVR
ncbi:MAG: hypothetical protein RXR43_08795 [Sulfolobus sp.]